MEKIHQLTKQTMELVGQTVRNTPSIPTVEEMKLRLALEFEELFEKAQAMGLAGSFELIAYKSFIKHSNSSQEEKNNAFTQIDTPWSQDGIFMKDTNKVNLVEVLDACLDQRVVASGTDLCFGFQNVIIEGDYAVWRSNMSKFDKEFGTAIEGVEAYKNGTHPHGKGVIDAYVHSKDGYHIIKRSDNHKYLKSLNYSPVYLRSLVGYEEPINTEKDGKQS